MNNEITKQISIEDVGDVITVYWCGVHMFTAIPAGTNDGEQTFEIMEFNEDIITQSATYSTAFLVANENQRYASSGY